MAFSPHIPTFIRAQGRAFQRRRGPTIFEFAEGFELMWRFAHFKGESDARIEVMIRDWLDDVAHYATLSFRNHVPVHSGELLKSIQEGVVDKHAYGWSVTVGTESEHADWVHKGTGIFGPRHQEIGHGNIMVFNLEDKKEPTFIKVPGKKELKEGVIFAKRIKGQEPQPFLNDVHKDVDAYIRVRKRELARRISRVLSG